MLVVVIALSVAALAVAASVDLALQARARYERRLEDLLGRLDAYLIPISESLDRAVERTAAAREQGAAEDVPAPPALEQLQRDELTGLWNRRGYEAELRREVDAAQRTGRPLSVVLVDLEERGKIGSERDPETERRLQDFAALLVGLTRASDTVCRCGADEFGVVLPATPVEGARRFQARVREEVTSSTFGKPGQLTFTVGLAEWQPNETSDALDARVAAAVGSENGLRTLRRD